MGFGSTTKDYIADEAESLVNQSHRERGSDLSDHLASASLLVGFGPTTKDRVADEAESSGARFRPVRAPSKCRAVGISPTTKIAVPCPRTEAHVCPRLAASVSLPLAPCACASVRRMCIAGCHS